MKIEVRRHNELYNISDGLYSSYWAGKFVNSFIKAGNKGSSSKQIELILLGLKRKNNIHPLKLLLEGLERFRPIFNIGVIMLRGRKRYFPVVINKNKRTKLALFWLKKEIQGRHEQTFYRRLEAELRAVEEHLNRHILVKKRDNFFRDAIKFKYNLRFNF
jgi:ribosomal protein S7